MFTVPAKWEELPLSELSRHCLQAAINYLPYFLNSTTGIDDGEVRDFTQNGGWQKLDSLLPLLHHSGGSVNIDHLGQFADKLKVGVFSLL